MASNSACRLAMQVIEHKYCYMKRFSLFLMLIFIFLSVAGGYPTGQVLDRTYYFEDAGKNMPYTLYLPKAYSAKKIWPLVVALHGLFSNPSQIIRYPRLTAQAEKYGYIVVAPMGYNTVGWYGSRGQLSFYTKPNNLGELSEKDVLNVVTIIQKEFSVDSRNIFLMGHSMGGGGTWHLGMKYPEKWAVLGPLAPAAPRNINDLKKIKDTPVIMVMGTKDSLWRSGLKWVEEMKRLNMHYEYIEVKNGGHVRSVIERLPEVFNFFEKHRHQPVERVDY